MNLHNAEQKTRKRTANVASDTGEEYFKELIQEHEVWKNRKAIWKKVSQSVVNDFGDCEKCWLRDLTRWRNAST